MLFATQELLHSSLSARSHC